MYAIKPRVISSIVLDSTREGERIEDVVDRAVNNNEPITADSPIIYQSRNEGVNPAYDPRTDRFEIAQEAMGSVAKSKIARRENIVQMPKKDTGTGENPDNKEA